jgi:hypothetical protein
MTTTPSITSPPSPTATTDEAAFIADLRRLKTWSGHSFRQLERRASAAGDTLPYSTVATMLSRNRLPREDLLVTFVRACGLDEDAVIHWATVRARIAYGISDTSTDRHPTSPRRRAFRWRQTLVGAAVVLAFAGGAALTEGTVNDSTVDEEIVVSTLVRG